MDQMTLMFSNPNESISCEIWRSFRKILFLFHDRFQEKIWFWVRLAIIVLSNWFHEKLWLWYEIPLKINQFDYIKSLANCFHEICDDFLQVKWFHGKLTSAKSIISLIFVFWNRNPWFHEFFKY